MARDVTTTTIDLLRHGQCQGGEIFRGSTDVALTELGWQQMRDATAESPRWDQVVSSSLTRCQQFSQELSGKHRLPLTVDDALREIHFGDWEGLEHAQVQKEFAGELQAFWNDPVASTPPNGEPITDFRQRVLDCFTALMDECRGQHLLLVTHGAVIRVLMCELLGMPLSSISNISVPYACLTRFKSYQVGGEKPWLQLCFHRGE